MPNHKLDHESNRGKVCAPCGRKLVCNKSKPSRFKVNSKQAEMIKSLLNPDFNLTDGIYPLGICGSCRIALTNNSNGNRTRPLPIMPNYKDIILPKETRTSDTGCNCFICRVARQQGNKTFVEKGRGHMRCLGVVIDEDNGKYGASSKEELPVKLKEEQEQNTMQICTWCKSEIGKGKEHQCKISHVPGNIEKIIETLPQKQKDQLIHSLLQVILFCFLII